MSDFVTLTQEMRQLAGLSGTGPTDVATATGIELQLVRNVRDAWIRIQSARFDWKWMWKEYEVPSPGSGALQSVANTEDYILTGVDKIHVNTFRNYLTATGTTDRQRMNFLTWEDWRARYNVVTVTASRPRQCTRLPNGNLRLYKPDGIYSIEFEIQKTPQILAVNNDIPEMPARFHPLIVYEALKIFGKANDAPEVIKLAEEEGGSEGGEGRNSSGIWRDLIVDQWLRSSLLDSENPHMVVRAV
jgi:hypothetical protein